MPANQETHAVLSRARRAGSTACDPEPARPNSVRHAVKSLPFGIAGAGFLLGLAAAQLGTAGAAPSSSNVRIYVSNERSGDVSIIDSESRGVIDTIAVGKRPRGIHLCRDGRTLYVAVSGSPRMGPGADPERSQSARADKSADGIAVVETARRKHFATMRVGSDPEQFALSGDERRLIVSNEDDAQASVVDIASSEVVRRMAVGEEPEGVGVNPGNGEIYVTCEGDGAVYVFDAAGETLVARIPVGGRPRSVTFSIDGSRAYIPSETTASVAVIDAHAHRVLQAIALPGKVVLPMGSALTPDGKFLLVTTGRGNSVAVVDVAAGVLVRVVPVGGRPWGIAIDGRGRFAYTANGATDDVSIVDLSSWSEVGRVKAGKGPWGIAIGYAPEVSGPAPANPGRESDHR